VSHSLEQNPEAINKWFTAVVLREAAEAWQWEEDLGRPVSLIETQMKPYLLAGGNEAFSLRMPAISNIETIGQDAVAMDLDALE